MASGSTRSSWSSSCRRRRLSAMDDQRKPDPDPGHPVVPDPAAEPRDLSFLWPALDRIRAVEIKLVADDAAAHNADVAARLKALEADVAAIREMLHQALGTPMAGAHAEPEPAAEPPELLPQTAGRATLGIVTAVALLLLAHLLVVFALDLPTLVLRLVSIDRKSTRLNSSHEWISYAVF